MLDVNNAVSNFIKQLVNKEKQKIVSELLKWCAAETSKLTNQNK